MRLLWLPEALRAAGLTVHEVDGWRTRGDNSYGPVRGITCHHTAGARTSTDAGEIGVLLHGSTTAPPPIAQLYLSRTGHWWVVASGLCYHSLVGWAGPNKGFGNDSLLGIEAQHSGAGEPWTDTQYRSYVRGVAALVAHSASGYTVPVSHVAGHKEHQPRAKTDPSFDMDQFRADVRAVLAGEDDNMPTVNEIKAAILGDGGMQQLFARVEALVSLRDTIKLADDRTESNKLAGALLAEASRDRRLAAAVQELAAAPGVDLQALADQLAAALAGALPAAEARQVADLVVAGIGERLSGAVDTTGVAS